MQIKKALSKAIAQITFEQSEKFNWRENSGKRENCGNCRIGENATIYEIYCPILLAKVHPDTVCDAFLKKER